jgi:hypothetical protein
MGTKKGWDTHILAYIMSFAVGLFRGTNKGWTLNVIHDITYDIIHMCII